ncbi:MAG: SMC-Scp complex subunit ScpB [DPANN group archaeon]|nr:SMC-Scp complex subunit ScpB [DPANN group archaeon]
MAKQKVPQQVADVQASEDINEEELKARLEAILYCIPDGVTIEKLGERLGIAQRGKIKDILVQIQNERAGKRGVQLVNESNLWKFKVPDEYMPIVKDIATPELEKSVLETLAYVAWRGGSRQCDVVRVRSNKAYNHIKLLIEKGFIESSKAGLSKWLEPTKKFYEYFKLQQGQKLEVPGGLNESNADEVIAAGMKALFG